MTPKPGGHGRPGSNHSRSKSRVKWLNRLITFGLIFFSFINQPVYFIGKYFLVPNFRHWGYSSIKSKTPARANCGVKFYSADGLCLVSKQKTLYTSLHTNPRLPSHSTDWPKVGSQLIGLHVLALALQRCWLRSTDLLRYANSDYCFLKLNRSNWVPLETEFGRID